MKSIINTPKEKKLSKALEQLIVLREKIKERDFEKDEIDTYIYNMILELVKYE